MAFLKVSPDAPTSIASTLSLHGDSTSEATRTLLTDEGPSKLYFTRPRRDTKLKPRFQNSIGIVRRENQNFKKYAPSPPLSPNGTQPLQNNKAIFENN